MRNLRNAMLVAVVAAAALAAIAGFFLGGPPSRLLVDAGLAVALAVIVGVMLSPTVARTDMLVEALRALARGDRHQRVDPDQFAGLGDVARAANEVAASLTEGEDPNLGPIKSQPRPGKPSRREAPPPGVAPSEHPEIGPVRVLKKSEGNGEKKSLSEPPKTRVLSAPPDSVPGRASSSQTPSFTSATPTSAAPSTSSTSSTSSTPSTSSAEGSDVGARSAAPSRTNDTNIDDAPRSDLRSNESDPPHVPSRAELEGLFQEFVAAKKSHGEAVADLDVDAFAQTIQGECERLIAAHRCKGVRFEVTMQDGEVSLRPRLLR